MTQEETAARRRRLWLFAALCLAVLVVAEAVWIYATIVQFWGPAQDYWYYRNLGIVFLETGQFYLPHQLAGEYWIQVMVDVLYPPNALLLFVPFAFLPAPLWWVIPIGLTLHVIRGLNPKPWAYVLMLLLLMWPRAVGAFLFGNTDMWAMAGVAAGVRWGWPAVLLLLKPTFAPFALIGIRQKRWWVALLALCAFSLLQLPLWFDYLTAMRNTTLDPWYSLGSFPLLLIPLVAWMGRSAPQPSQSQRVGVAVTVRSIAVEPQEAGVVAGSHDGNATAWSVGTSVDEPAGVPRHSVVV